jgi:hypothetical protein
VSDTERGFGPGFEKDVAAILATADRGLLYAREVRENLARAGMIIYDSVEMPDVEPPQYNDGVDELQLVNNNYPADEEDAEDE